MRREVYRKWSEEVRNLPACSRISYAQRCCTNIKNLGQRQNIKWSLKVGRDRCMKMDSVCLCLERIRREGLSEI